MTGQEFADRIQKYRRPERENSRDRIGKMKVFQTPEEVDYNWVRKRETVDYGYGNRGGEKFSPVNLLNKLKEI